MMPEHDPESSKSKSGLTGKLLGWVVMPLLVASLLVGAGVHLGATQPDAWYTRVVRFVAGR